METIYSIMITAIIRPLLLPWKQKDGGGRNISNIKISMNGSMQRNIKFRKGIWSFQGSSMNLLLRMRKSGQ